MAFACGEQKITATFRLKVLYDGFWLIKATSPSHSSSGSGLSGNIDGELNLYSLTKKVGVGDT